MFNTNLQSFSDEDLMRAYQEIEEYDRTKILPYGLVKEKLDSARRVYPEYDANRMCYLFSKEISRRWYQENKSRL